MSRLSPLNYKNKSINYIRKTNILEYDIRNGGYSVTVSDSLIEDEDTLEDLILADRHEKHIILGNYIKDNPEYIKILHNGFRKYTTLFCKTNNISMDDILTIAKDSVTFFSKKASKSFERIFNEVEFTERGLWSSYLSLGQMELFCTDDAYKFKGISDKMIIEGTLLEEALTLMRMNETLDKKSVSKYMTEIRQAYVNRELDDSYYRELSPLGGFHYNSFSLPTMGITSEFALCEPEELDITYNYNKIIIPLCQVFA